MDQGADAAATAGFHTQFYVENGHISICGCSVRSYDVVNHDKASREDGSVVRASKT